MDSQPRRRSFCLAPSLLPPSLSSQICLFLPILCDAHNSNLCSCSRALQYPNIDILYRACDVAGVRCQHSVVIRDPYRVLRSTSMNRHFASRHVQLTTLASMQHIVLSQMMIYPDRLVACWEADTETPKDLGLQFGWTNPDDFEEAYNKLFIVPSPITADDRTEITKDDHLKVYMDGMVASNNRIKELCYQQLERNQQAKVSTVE